MSEPKIIHAPLPGQAVDAHLKRYGRLPSEYAEGCPFVDRPDITCTQPECGCLEQEEEAPKPKTLGRDLGGDY